MLGSFILLSSLSKCSFLALDRESVTTENPEGSPPPLLMKEFSGGIRPLGLSVSCLFSSPTLQSPSGFKPGKASPSPSKSSSPSRGRGRGSCRGHKGLVSNPSTYSCSPQLARAFKINQISSNRIPKVHSDPQDGILLVWDPPKNQGAEFHVRNAKKMDSNS